MQISLYLRYLVMCQHLLRTVNGIMDTMKNILLLLTGIIVTLLGIFAYGLYGSHSTSPVQKKEVEELSTIPTSSPIDQDQTPTPSDMHISATPDPTTPSPTVSPSPTPETPIPTLANDSHPLESGVLFRRVNAYRESQGREHFIESQRLCFEAEKRTQEIQEEMNHDIFFERFADDPYPHAEVIVQARTEVEALNIWLDDKVHRDIIVGDYNYACFRCDGDKCVGIVIRR